MDELILRWQTRICAEAMKGLGRRLTEVELRFITSRQGYIALEMIDDTVKSLSATELEKYLNFERAGA